jgi:tetratricopeptide (TPR) repeat protein
MKLNILLFILILIVSNSFSQSFEECMQKGKALYEESKYKQSLSYFNKAVSLSKYSEEAYLYRGKAKYSLNDMEGAKKDFKVNINLNPQNA